MVVPVLGSAQERFHYPVSIAASDAGTFLADRNLPGVWKLDGDSLTPFYTGSKKFRTPLNAIRCIEFDGDGKLLVGDSATREIYRFGDDGKPVALTNGGIGIPMDIAVNKAGDLYVSNLEIQRIVKVPKAGGEPEEVTQISGCRRRSRWQARGYCEGSPVRVSAHRCRRPGVDCLRL
jgi:hypothetical protein